MKRDVPSYRGYRFPPEIISHAVWLYHRFGVSFRDVEDLLAQRGLTVSYEAIRLWCLTFGAAYARRLTRRQGRLGDIWHLDEVFVTIQGRRHYLWRAVDQDGDIIDILVQSHRDCRAATRFFRKLLKGQERQPVRLVTDKLSSYRAAHRAVMPSVAHRTDRYENNRAEVAHQPTRQRERQCAGSNLPGRHNDSCPCMDSSATSSALAVTWCERCIIGSDEVALFSCGMPSRSPPDSN